RSSARRSTTSSSTLRAGSWSPPESVPRDRPPVDNAFHSCHLTWHRAVAGTQGNVDDAFHFRHVTWHRTCPLGTWHRTCPRGTSGSVSGNRNATRLLSLLTMPLPLAPIALPAPRSSHICT